MSAGYWFVVCMYGGYRHQFLAVVGSLDAAREKLREEETQLRLYLEGQARAHVTGMVVRLCVVQVPKNGISLEEAVRSMHSLYQLLQDHGGQVVLPAEVGEVEGLVADQWDYTIGVVPDSVRVSGPHGFTQLVDRGARW